MKKQPDVILIRGAPGSGKSLTAKCLAEYFPKGARMEVDTIRSMAVSPDWTDQREHVAMLDVSTRVVRDFLVMGFRPVIVVDTFSRGKTGKFVGSLRRLIPGISLCIVGLFTSEKELQKRIMARKKGEFRRYDICHRLNEEVKGHRYRGEHQIDTTGMSPVETARAILNNLDGSKRPQITVS